MILEYRAIQSEIFSLLSNGTVRIESTLSCRLSSFAIAHVRMYK